MMQDTSVGPDERLVHRMAGGDEEALQTLHRRHSPSVYALAYGLLVDPAEAEEVVADTFAYAWRMPSQFFVTANRSVFGWLNEVARSRARAVLQSREWPARSETRLQ
jgi:DNA-directed RNA polymerase specialized sigma24 family protein